MPEGLRELTNSVGYSMESSSIIISTNRYAVKWCGILQEIACICHRQHNCVMRE